VAVVADDHQLPPAVIQLFTPATSRLNCQLKAHEKRESVSAKCAKQRN
jgi:hypothetical protein